jgi:hypothetical protein
MIGGFFGAGIGGPMVGKRFNDEARAPSSCTAPLESRKSCTGGNVFLASAGGESPGSAVQEVREDNSRSIGRHR